MKTLSAANTDTGRKRTNNEDAFLIDQELRLYAVADGIGGHSGGEVASRIAVETLRERVREDRRERDPGDVLNDAFILGNTRVIEAGATDRGLAGMGTTLTAVLLKGTSAHLAHAGDSRAYLLREGMLEQVTEDHGVVAEQVRAGIVTPDQARRSPYRHIITRALGIERELLVDRRTIELRENDVLLLCTDGLTEMIEDREIERILLSSALPDAVQGLIAAANRNGGVDNITVVVVKVEELP
ncbi:MAG: hypothetical protein A2010_13820 [Nitrospirae bacterium GWD2_57_9]|nr:MAG: hypothetical protein A2010_13820 [Nitrospirae bacterium GWD2_57_9]OGW46460.1 MAG: hypothetical protein A2078_02835 [Nitrospirae bacterium GWC2_57_9]